MDKQTFNLETLVQFIIDNRLKCQIVLRDKQTDWVDWISIPEKGYLDYGGEPVSFSNISSIVLSPIVKVNVGRLLPPKLNNYTDEIQKLLNSIGLPFDHSDNDFIIKLIV